MVSIVTCSLPHPHRSPLPLPLQPHITCSDSSAHVCYMPICCLFSAFPASHRPDSCGMCVRFWPSSLLHEAHALLCPSPSSWLQALPPSPTPQNPPLCSIALYVQNGLPRTCIHLLTMLPQIIPPEGLPSLQASLLLCLQVTVSAVPALFLAIHFSPWKVLFGALTFSWILSFQK